MQFIGVCGGRDYADRNRVDEILKREVPADGVVVTGGARGADSLAELWARWNDIHVVTVPALWDNFGKSAGARRNAVIAALPLAKLVAFPGGSGTADMVRKARAAGIPVVMVDAT